jgi:hypothetical protein
LKVKSWKGERREDNAEAPRARRNPEKKKARIRIKGVEIPDRKSPPFIPKKHRDGAEVAKSAKDGAPSSTWVDGAEKRNPRPTRKAGVWGTPKKTRAEATG